jgi:hypothetical protein
MSGLFLKTTRHVSNWPKEFGIPLINVNFCFVVISPFWLVNPQQQGKGSNFLLESREAEHWRRAKVPTIQLIRFTHIPSRKK